MKPNYFNPSSHKVNYDDNIEMQAYGAKEVYSDELSQHDLNTS